MSLDSTTFVFDSTLLIMVISGVICYFGLPSNTKNESNKYATGIILIIVHFLVPLFVFYELHFGYIKHGDVLWLNNYFLSFFLIQIVLMLFLIYCFYFLNIDNEYKIKRFISKHSFCVAIGQTLNVLLSWVMVGFGLYYSVNVC